MERVLINKEFTAIYIKPHIGIKELEKYGFRQNPDSKFTYQWKPSFTCKDYEKQYYEDNDYLVYINSDGQIVLYPNQWFQLSGKIQTLLFDMITDGIVEKRTYEYDGFSYRKEVKE